MSTATAMFPCRVGLTEGAGVNITSPRTGTRLSVPRSHVDRLPPRFASRIVAAVARGVHTLDFSTEQLTVFAGVAAAAARPAVGFGAMNKLPPSRYARSVRSWSR